jgi:hypothetical protein
VAGVLDGYTLDTASVRQYAHGLTARQKQQTCQEAIRRTQAALPDAALTEIIVYFERNLQLSPQCAAVLFAALAQMQDPIDARIFEVQTRSLAHQEEFGALSESDRKLIWPALTPQQRRRLASLGHAPGAPATRRGRPSRRERESEFPASRMPALSETATLDPEPQSFTKSTT